MRIFYLVFLSLIFLGKAIGQNPVLVNDFNEGPEGAFVDRFDISGDEFYLDRIAMEIDENTLVFSAIKTDVGDELAALKDGQMSLVKDIFPGAQSSKPRWFIKYNNEVYFSAVDSQHGGAIWKTDGTEAGTQMVIDVDPATDDTRPVGLIVSKSNHLYFTFGDKLFKSDGTPNGTIEIFDGVDFTIERLVRTPHYCTYKDGIAFLTKDANNIIQLFEATDTVVLLDQLETDPSRLGKIYGINQVTAGLIFTVDDFTNEDVTGTYVYNEQDEIISKFFFGDESPYLRRTMELNEDIQIAHVLGLGYYSLNGFENQSDSLPLDFPFAIGQGEILIHKKSNNKLIFKSNDGFFSEFIASTDGTSSGTEIIAVTETSNVSNMISYNDYIFWRSGVLNFNGFEYFYSNTKTGETERFLFLEPYSIPSNTSLLFGVQKSKLYLLSDLDPDVGMELYSIDLNFSPFVSTKDASRNLSFEIQQNNNGFNVVSDKNEEMELRVYDLSGKLVEKRSIRTNSFVEGLHRNEILFYNFRYKHEQLTKKAIF